MYRVSKINDGERSSRSTITHVHHDIPRIHRSCATHQSGDDHVGREDVTMGLADLRRESPSRSIRGDLFSGTCRMTGSFVVVILWIKRLTMVSFFSVFVLIRSYRLSKYSKEPQTLLKEISGRSMLIERGETYNSSGSPTLGKLSFAKLLKGISSITCQSSRTRTEGSRCFASCYE